MALFAGWIDKGDKALKEIPYKFNLILRGSKDGFNTESFHYKCDNKRPTIVVAKIKETNQIVGGYNPLDWVYPLRHIGGTYKTTQDSFIFSFSDYKHIKT